MPGKRRCDGSVDGNPAYMGTAMKALEDIHKVWGAESPKQVQVEAEVQVVSPQEQLIRIAGTCGSSCRM